MKVQRSRCQPSGRRLPRLKVTPREFVSDLKVLRDQPELFGEVASQPTAWGAEPTYKSNVPRARRSLVKAARLNFSGPGPLRPAGSTEPLALNTMLSRQSYKPSAARRPPGRLPRRLDGCQHDRRVLGGEAGRDEDHAVVVGARPGPASVAVALHRFLALVGVCLPVGTHDELERSALYAAWWYGRR